MGRAPQRPWRGLTSGRLLKQIVIGALVWTGAGVLLLGCGAPSPNSTNRSAEASTTTTTTTSIPAHNKGSNTAHVMVIMMENEGASNIIGNPALPYVTSLANDYGSATNSYALAHPSLPNYLTIVSGSSQGITGDQPPSAGKFPKVPTLGDQLAAAGVSERAYAENLPAQPTLDAGVYAVRHNPWEYFPNARIAVVDASTLTGDLNSPNPPGFVWYTPNVNDDGHTGVPIDTQASQLAGAETFLAKFIPAVQATTWYRSGGQIIIEWDEALDSDTSGINGGQGGHVATIVVSNMLKARPVRDSTPVDTAGILRSLEDVFRVPHLANASNAANGTIDSLLGVASTTP
jgi:acid phosphatase